MKTALVDFRTPYDALVEKESLEIGFVPFTTRQAYILDGLLGISGDRKSAKELARELNMTVGNVGMIKTNAISSGKGLRWRLGDKCVLEMWMGCFAELISEKAGISSKEIRKKKKRRKARVRLEYDDILNRLLPDKPAQQDVDYFESHVLDSKRLSVRRVVVPYEYMMAGYRCKAYAQSLSEISRLCWLAKNYHGYTTGSGGWIEADGGKRVIRSLPSKNGKTIAVFYRRHRK